MARIITNEINNTSKKQIIEIAKNADKIEIATAFFSYSQLLKEWEKENKKIILIVSLRPPTSYFALQDVLSSINIEVNFLGDEFHSKFFIFYKNNEIIGAVIGSSNFTSGGLIKNTETNIHIRDSKALAQLKTHFSYLYQDSNLLQPDDLDQYEKVYNNFLQRKKIEEKELKKFNDKITSERTKRKDKSKINKEARQFTEFWNIVNEVRTLVKTISDTEFPNIPTYLVIDHFWHYVKVQWLKDNPDKIIDEYNRQKEVPKIFKQYVKWQKLIGDNYPKWMYQQSKKVFNVRLSKSNIDNLTKEEVKEVFSYLHSSAMRIMRFNADDRFIALNDIRKIRKSLKYLLYSNDEMDLKIHNLMKNPIYKLQQLGSSGIQEINGWANPSKIPIRNDKADEAIQILGYKYN